MTSAEKLYDIETSQRFLELPSGHEEADAALNELLDELQDQHVRFALEAFIAGASLRDKTNLLNSRSFLLPSTDGLADDWQTCAKKICEPVCRMVCREQGKHDPKNEPDCKEICHQICCCPFEK